MTVGDRLTVVGIGVGVIIAIANGTCSTNQRFADLQRNMEAGFVEAAQQRREAAVQAAQQRREAAVQRREEHDQIIRRLERLEDLHLKPAAAGRTVRHGRQGCEPEQHPSTTSNSIARRGPQPEHPRNHGRDQSSATQEANEASDDALPEHACRSG